MARLGKHALLLIGVWIGFGIVSAWLWPDMPLVLKALGAMALNIWAAVLGVLAILMLVRRQRTAAAPAGSAHRTSRLLMLLAAALIGASIFAALLLAGRGGFAIWSAVIAGAVGTGLVLFVAGLVIGRTARRG